MTIQEFVKRYTDEYVEEAGSADAKNQCVDLANRYIREVLGLPIIEWANAKDFPLRAGDKYDWIANTPTGVPIEGDLVIWGGLYGHIAVFLKGDANSFDSFDENFPTGSPCHIQHHSSYANVLGWLHPKSAVIAQPIPQPSTAVFTDQTKLPAYLLGTDQDLEIQQIRGMLGDLKRLQNQPPPSLADRSTSELWAELAKRLFGR